MWKQLSGSQCDIVERVGSSHSDLGLFLPFYFLCGGGFSRALPELLASLTKWLFDLPFTALRPQTRAKEMLPVRGYMCHTCSKALGEADMRFLKICLSHG